MSAVTDDLKTLALKAIAEAPVGGTPRRIAAVKLMREWTQGQRYGLRDLVEAVQWAEGQPPGGLTRADKERAVAELVSRLALVSEDYAFACADRGDDSDGDWQVLQRRQVRLQAALVRLAMARTVD